MDKPQKHDERSEGHAQLHPTSRGKREQSCESNPQQGGTKWVWPQVSGILPGAAISLLTHFCFFALLYHTFSSSVDSYHSILVCALLIWKTCELWEDQRCTDEKEPLLLRRKVHDNDNSLCQPIALQPEQLSMCLFICWRWANLLLLETLKVWALKKVGNLKNWSSKRKN